MRQLTFLSPTHTLPSHVPPCFIHSADPDGQEMHPGSGGLISREGVLNLLVFGLHGDFASSSFSLDLGLNIGILFIRHPDPFLAWVAERSDFERDSKCPVRFLHCGHKHPPPPIPHREPFCQGTGVPVRTHPNPGQSWEGP